MRNRGYLAHYLRDLGSYQPVGFGIGTFLTLAKEFVRLLYVERTLRGWRPLLRGWRAARRVMREPWQPVGTRELTDA